MALVELFVWGNDIFVVFFTFGTRLQFALLHFPGTLCFDECDKVDFTRRSWMQTNPKKRTNRIFVFY